MQKIFEQISHPHLTGTIIWEPMMADDDIAAANTQQELFQDSRVQHYWDADKVLGKNIADSMLENTRIAWDIYLLYQPGRNWDSDEAYYLKYLCWPKVSEPTKRNKNIN